jgi:hypothetical protein
MESLAEFFRRGIRFHPPRSNKATQQFQIVGLLCFIKDADQG